MTSRRRTQLIGLSGEYYVAAELNRRGVHTVTFTGNIPDIDAIAITPRRRAIYIQVKTQRGRGWAVDINERSKKPNRNIVWVLVELGEKKHDERKRPEPKYWIMPDKDMRDLIQTKWDTARPGEYDGKAQFAQLLRKDIAEWEDRWDFLTGSPAS